MDGHPGVSLYQKVQGGTYYAAFLNPTDRRLVRKRVRTDDFTTASRVASELSVLLRTKPDEPPDGLHPMTCALYGRPLLETRADEAALAAILYPPYLKGPVDWDGRDLAKGKANLLGKIGDLVRERDSWRNRAVAAEGQLRQMGKRLVRNVGALATPLDAAVAKWLAGFQGRDSEYRRDVAITLRAFARQLHPAKLGDMQDREKDIEAWIYGLRRGKDGKPIGSSRRVEIRRAVVKFLEDSGVQVNRKAIRRPGQREVKRDRGPVRWRSKAQAQAVAKALPDPWADVFRIQVCLGLRPSEVATLKRGDFSPDGSRLTLSPLDSLTLKNGSRTMSVPDHVRAIVRRRSKAGDILFPAKRGKPWRTDRAFCREYSSALHSVEARTGTGRVLV